MENYSLFKSQLTSTTLNGALEIVADYYRLVIKVIPSSNKITRLTSKTFLQLTFKNPILYTSKSDRTYRWFINTHHELTGTSSRTGRDSSDKTALENWTSSGFNRLYDTILIVCVCQSEWLNTRETHRERQQSKVQRSGKSNVLQRGVVWRSVY